MSFKISKDIGKVGEFYPIDNEKKEDIFNEDIELEKDGFYVFDDSLILVKDNNVYVYRNKI